MSKNMEEEVEQYLRNVERDSLESLSKKFPEEHWLAVLKTSIEVFPVIGSTLATILDEYYPDRQIERIISFIERLTRRVGWLEHQIKVERVKTEEFGDLFIQTLRTVAHDHQQEKIEAYRAILLNALIIEDFSIDEAEFFLTLVQELTVPHIKMLRVLANPQGSVPADLHFEEQVGPNSSLHLSVQDVLYRVFTGGPDGYVDAIWVGLQARGLVMEMNYRQRVRYKVSGAPVGSTYDHTDRVLADLPHALTLFGRRFIHFITEPPEAQKAEEAN